jgi:putative phosphoribosyl transferase
MRTPNPYRDRREAGRVLSTRLSDYANRTDVVVLALPTGGIPVAFEVANALGAPLDVHFSRKLGVPDEPGLTLGAIGEGGHTVLNRTLLHDLGISREQVEDSAVNEWLELDRHRRTLRQGRSRPPLAGKIAVLVDEGLATSPLALAAVRDLRAHDPERIVVAVPVADANACHEIENEADEVACAMIPTPFSNLENWYHESPPVTDEESRDLLERARSRNPG